MNQHARKRAGAQCGLTVSGRFIGDICRDLDYWKCRECCLIITAANPPDLCPTCNMKCPFVNVTCYTPECGGPGNIDPRLL